ncbi:MAG TPA: class I SAM-dependent methyltransferase [Vineibacter sp.]|nr:class I SAM-dependent methyltransferase [Vineibacter sp.]
MPTSSASGTQGYGDDAATLAARYDSVAFADVHRPVLHLIPATTCSVLDIGAGSGRDAAALAAMGHRVLAVEPTPPLRRLARDAHRSPGIEWLDDSLPDLAVVRARCDTFDLILLSAVWMHLDASQRQAAMPGIATLLRPGGVVVISLRHGPLPPGRRMFDVTAEETIRLAEEVALRLLLRDHGPSVLPGKPDVCWTHLAFAAVP